MLTDYFVEYTLRDVDKTVQKVNKVSYFLLRGLLYLVFISGLAILTSVVLTLY